MRLDPWWRPALILIGATPGRSDVSLDADSLLVRLGFFRFRVARGRIVAARRTGGLWWYGIGIHTDFRGGVAYNGSLDGMVELQLQPPAAWRTLLLPVSCSRLYVSLEEPEALLAALGVPETRETAPPV